MGVPLERVVPMITSTSVVHVHDDDPIRVRESDGSFYVSPGADATRSWFSLELTRSAAVRVRDGLSAALGDDGFSRVVGVYQGSVVTVDDHGLHLTLLDDLTELDSCRMCVDQPATTTDERDRHVCPLHNCADDKEN